MRTGTWKDRKVVHEVLSETFKDNPSVILQIGNDKRSNLKFTRLIDYAFSKSLDADGVLVSNNEKGIALINQYTNNKRSLRTIWYLIKYLTCFNPKELFNIISRENYLNRIRKQHHPYIYFWFLGVKKGGDRAAFELKAQVFKLSKILNRPVLLETSVKRNTAVYEKTGFRTYYEWLDPKTNLTTWFLKSRI